MTFQFITFNPDILGGKPIIKGTRISVEIIMEWVISGASVQDIYKEHTHLPKGSVEEAIQYAARFTDNEIWLEEEIA
jgi:uncharacterized protein (DUF433 family)